MVMAVCFASVNWLSSGPVGTGWHEIGTELEIEILGEFFKAAVIGESPQDPQNEKLRAK